MKNFRYSLFVKTVLFAILVLSFVGGLHGLIASKGDFGIVFEDHYYKSKEFVRDHAGILEDLRRLIDHYKSEQYIMEGNTIMYGYERVLFGDFACCSGLYNDELSEEDNYKVFLQVYYPEQLERDKNQHIKNDLREYQQILAALNEHDGLVYYATDGQHVFANSPLSEKGQFRDFRVFFIFEGLKEEVYPDLVEQNRYYYRISGITDRLESAGDKIYVALKSDYLNRKMEDWQQRKEEVEKQFAWFVASAIGLVLSFAALAAVAGRTSHADRTIRLGSIDKWYVDFNLCLIALLGLCWLISLEEIHDLFVRNENRMLYYMDGASLLFALAAFPLVLSVVRHAKNRSLFRHTLIYTIIRKAADGVRQVYRTGSIGVKTVLLVIGYPLLVVATFFMFPVTLGLAAWFALKKIKAFNAIREGVERIRKGDLHYKIQVEDKGELAELAGHINGIADGLKQAVDNELKSERLKTELITNVSHDIRTPLTSIITYVDLLKNEQDPAKAQEYIGVLEQKSQKLKALTDDLFEAAKASSGNIPVNPEDIDLVSLIRQGMGELNDQAEKTGLQFKWIVPDEKLLVRADGKLLWRAIENLLSNIFKYALNGSRVYIEIEGSEREVTATFKNISAQELNMPADELLERFTRGDASRTGDGSGLGLNIAKSLIELQHGKLEIEIDGDLFKAIIRLPKAVSDHEGFG